MRRAAVLLILPLLLPTLPLVEAAEEPKARWLGPTGMLEGWHVRIPVQVTNHLHNEVVNGVVSYDLRLAEVLLDAGWVVSRKGASLSLESWELDPHSVRVAEYQGVAGGAPLDGILLGEVPSRATQGLFDATRPFHNRTQPDLHVEWVVPGSLAPNATRTFMVYVDTLTNGRKAPAGYAEAQMAPIDGRGWISRGTTVYGTAGKLTLVGLENDTSVRVDIYQGSKPIPRTANGERPNPMLLHQGEVFTDTLGEDGVLVRIVSDKPVAAFGYKIGGAKGGNMPPFAGPIPSTNGGVLGTQFFVPGDRAGVMAITPGEPATVTATPGGTVRLTGGAPVSALPLVGAGPSQPYRIASTSPIMLLEWTGDGMAQFPSLWGAPTGNRLVGIPYVGRLCNPCDGAEMPPCTMTPLAFSRHPQTKGYLAVTVHDAPTSVRGRDLVTGELAFPRESDTRAKSTGVNLTPGTASTTQASPSGIGTGITRPGAGCPFLLYATKDTEDVAFHDKGRLQAWGGNLAANRDVFTPIGASGYLDPATGLPRPAGSSFWTYWPVSIVAHYNGTVIEVTAQDGSPVLRKSVGKGDLVQAGSESVSFTAPLHVKTNKPVVVLGQTAGGWFAGFDDSLRAVPVGKPQYRGYLVSLEPATLSTEPMQGIAAPGKGATYKLLVRNLAKDDQGRPVPDTVNLHLGGYPEGWSAQLSDTTLRLEGGGSKEVTLTVTPPPDAKEGLKATVPVTASSAGNPRMTDRLQVITIIRASYEVGVWFDRENAPPGKTVTLDPEETKDVTVVVKNLASVPDRVVVRATLSSPDWKTRFAEAPAALVEVALDAGESRALTLKLTAPPTKASQSNLEVSATSLSDASATAKQDATARVRADVRIALVANDTLVEAAPGQVAKLQVLFLNRGADRVGIRFNTTGAMPPGWERPVVRQGAYEIDEIAGIVPGAEVPLDIYVRVPANASRADRANVNFFVETMPQFVGDPVLREAIDLLVLAGARHDLAPIDPIHSLSLGFQDEVRAQLSLSNGGNGAEQLRVVPTRVPDGAGVVVGPPARIPVGGRGAVEMTIAFPTSTPAGTYAIAADVVADDGHALPWTFNVTVPERRLAALTPQGPLVGIAGVTERVEFEVANGGNVPLRLPPRVLLPDGWEHRWSGADEPLAPGASRLVALEILAPRDAPTGAHELAVDPTWATAEPIPWDLRTVALGADAALQQGSVAVRLRNDGTGDAFGVEVALLQGATVVDRAVLQRLPAQGNATAILAPRAGETGALRVLVDNETRYAPAPLEVPVSGEVARDVPAPALPLALALLALLALGRRLRRR